ncbi:MAG: hypothetical protein NVS4B7_21370 [Ktedonobacteraceae bacterium]
MYCPNCHTENLDEELTCSQCGADLTLPSKSLVTTTQNRLPAVLHSPQLPRVAASVGAVAVGVGIELLRRSLVARMTRPSQALSNTLPTLNRLKDVLFPQNEKKFKLPKNYEVEETVVYMKRVIRRK